jgi:MFS family permease
MSRAAPQFCSLSAANLQQFGFNTSIRRTAALSSPAPSIPTSYFYVRSACDGLRMMAMRPLHRAGADTGCGALRCPAVARDPHGRLHRARGLSDSALCNPPTSSTFGPVAGGYLTQAFGWRSIFLVNVPLGLAAAVMVLRLKTKPGDWRRTSFDAPGLVLFTLFVSPVILALEQVQRMDAGTLPLIAGLLAFGALALLALIWQEKHSTSPLIPPALFREPSVWRADAMTACHGAALVSSITFLPIYLRAVRGAAPAETGLLMLPLMFGIGIGSLVTGQLVTRSGRTAAFPSYGLVAATLGLLFLALSLSHLSLFELPWVFGAIACFMGTVMGVVQVTVQAVAGQRMLGTGAAMVQFSRSVGAAFGTAIVAAVLFSTIAARDPETARLFGAMIDHGPEAIAALTPARQAAVQSDIGEAFRAVFGTIAAFTGIGALLAFSMPLRKV